MASCSCACCFARRTPATSPLQYAGTPPGRPEPRVEPTLGAAPPSRFEPVMGSASFAAPVATPALGKFPPGFDPQPFVEQAKVQFRRMQAAYDSADRKALAEVMTPEMFSEVVERARGARRAPAHRGDATSTRTCSTSRPKATATG